MHLAKHIWFSGEFTWTLIRCFPTVSDWSFALGDWVKLGKSYPPALEKLKSIRDENGKKLSEDQTSHSLFADFAAINEHLGDKDKTRDFFVWLDTNNPAFAKTVFDLAEPALIERQGCNSLCASIWSQTVHFKRELDLYRDMKHYAAKSEFRSQREEYAEKSFLNEMATISRSTGCQWFERRRPIRILQCSKPVAEWTDPRLKAAFDKAKTGTVPQPLAIT